MKFALVPFNPKIADFKNNLARVIELAEEAFSSGSDIAVFPELALIGYPPQDLLLRPSFVQYADEQLQELHKHFKAQKAWQGKALIVGTCVASPEESANPLINAACFLNAESIEVRAKTLIPHYDIFHERRYFESALNLSAEFRAPIQFNDQKIGLIVCEDIWSDEVKYKRKLYSQDPCADLKKHGCELIINISASPFTAKKREQRRAVVSQKAKSHSQTILYVNQSGANDGIVFDGDCFVMDKEGELLSENNFFDSQTHYIESAEQDQIPGANPKEIEQIRQAIVCGIQDYVAKNGFKQLVLGLSGGIDSAVVAVLAAQALGPEKVLAFSLPGKFSSVHSITDADELCKRSGILYKNCPIKFMQSTMDMALKPFFGEKEADVTEENLQARLRGMVLMAISNKFGHLLLATGNKSELAVGYSTLYGDMCGSLSPIGDLYKSQVYDLAAHLNFEKEIIPQAIIDKAPSAELRPDQKDQDSLPDYALLDQALYAFIELEMSFLECEAYMKSQNLDLTGDELRRVEQMLWRSEFKRQQFAPILKLSSKAFGIGRRYPITSAKAEFC